MMSWLTAAAMVVAAVLAGATLGEGDTGSPPADGFSYLLWRDGQPVLWRQCSGIPVVVSLPDGDRGRAVTRAVRRAASLSGLRLRLRPGESEPGPPVEGSITIAWAPSSVAPLGPYVLGVTTPLSRDTELVGAAVQLNTDLLPGLNEDDIKRLVLHELGHALGVGHGGPGQVMAPGFEEKTTLTRGDRAAFAAAGQHCRRRAYSSPRPSSPAR